MQVQASARGEGWTCQLRSPSWKGGPLDTPAEHDLMTTPWSPPEFTFRPAPAFPTLQPVLNVLDSVLPMSPSAL